MARKGRHKPSDMQLYMFEVRLQNDHFEIHEVFASSEERARSLLTDRFLGQSPRITVYNKPRQKEGVKK